MEDVVAFHHVGVACRDIFNEAEFFGRLGYSIESDVFEDTIQGIRGIFLCGTGPRLELVEPLGEEGVLLRWLRGGVKFYHLAFEVPCLDAALASAQREGAKIVVDPVPAVAFEGASISFVVLRNMALIEYIEICHKN